MSNPDVRYVTSELILSAIYNLREKNAVSEKEITKYVCLKRGLTESEVKPYIKNYLQKALEKGVFVKKRGLYKIKSQLHQKNIFREISRNAEKTETNSCRYHSHMGKSASAPPRKIENSLNNCFLGSIMSLSNEIDEKKNYVYYYPDNTSEFDEEDEEDDFYDSEDDEEDFFDHMSKTKVPARPQLETKKKQEEGYLEEDTVNQRKRQKKNSSEKLVDAPESKKTKTSIQNNVEDVERQMFITERNYDFQQNDLDQNEPGLAEEQPTLDRDTVVEDRNSINDTFLDNKSEISENRVSVVDSDYQLEVNNFNKNSYKYLERNNRRINVDNYIGKEPAKRNIKGNYYDDREQNSFDVANDCDEGKKEENPEEDDCAEEEDQCAEEDDECDEEDDECAEEDEECAEEEDQCAEEDDECDEEDDECAKKDDECAKKDDECAEEDDECAEEDDECAEEDNECAEEDDECAEEDNECAEEDDECAEEDDQCVEEEDECAEEDDQCCEEEDSCAEEQNPNSENKGEGANEKDNASEKKKPDGCKNDGLKSESSKDENNNNEKKNPENKNIDIGISDKKKDALRNTAITTNPDNWLKNSEDPKTRKDFNRTESQNSGGVVLSKNNKAEIDVNSASNNGAQIKNDGDLATPNSGEPKNAERGKSRDKTNCEGTQKVGEDDNSPRKRKNTDYFWRRHYNLRCSVRKDEQSSKVRKIDTE